MSIRQPASVIITITLANLRRDDGGVLVHENYGRIMENMDEVMRLTAANALATARAELGSGVFTGETRTEWRLLEDDSLELKVHLRVHVGAVTVDDPLMCGLCGEECETCASGECDIIQCTCKCS